MMILKTPPRSSVKSKRTKARAKCRSKFYSSPPPKNLGPGFFARAWSILKNSFILPLVSAISGIIAFLIQKVYLFIESIFLKLFFGAIVALFATILVFKLVDKVGGFTAKIVGYLLLTATVTIMLVRYLN